MVPRRPDVDSAVPDQYLVEQIRRALAEDPRTGVLDVGVEVAGNRVVLSGTVTTDERATTISAVVEELLPDHNIDNQMSVEQIAESAAGRIEPEHLS
ncbi:MAG: BON domain-containing protein [Actinomycetota bacterium]|nr:BON domain-containing protein [Actinomycetota bacterium]